MLVDYCWTRKCECGSENRCISARMQEMDEWRRISTSPLDQLQAAPVPSDVPPLDARALASDSEYAFRSCLMVVQCCSLLCFPV